jgi:hypothetical protein
VKRKNLGRPIFRAILFSRLNRPAYGDRCHFPCAIKCRARVKIPPLVLFLLLADVCILISYVLAPSILASLSLSFPLTSHVAMADTADQRRGRGFPRGRGRGDRGGAPEGGERGFGRRGGRGRGRGDRDGGRGRGRSDKDEGGAWVPITKLGRLVKEGLIKRLEEIYLFSLPVKEYQIIDFFLEGKLKDEVSFCLFLLYYFLLLHSQ